MFKIHQFSTPTTFLGRNGQFMAAGIEVSTSKAFQQYPAGVELVPITSKNRPGWAIISIPREDIPAVIQLLQEALEQN